MAILNDCVCQHVGYCDGSCQHPKSAEPSALSALPQAGTVSEENDSLHYAAIEAARDVLPYEALIVLEQGGLERLVHAVRAALSLRQQEEAAPVEDDAPPLLWLSAPDIDNEHDVWFDDCEGGTKYIRADLASPVPADAGEPCVKALEWRDLSYKALDMVASHPFCGEYHVTEEREHEWPFVVRPFLTSQSNYQTFDEAKAACEADYEARIRSALVPATSQTKGSSE